MLAEIACLLVSPGSGPGLFLPRQTENKEHDEADLGVQERQGRV